MSATREELRRALLKHRVQQFRQDQLELAIDLLNDPDTKLQHSIGDALIRTGSIAIPAVAGALENGEPSVRRAVSYILGELLQHAHDLSATKSLRQALKDAEPKVRKNAAIALGKISDLYAVMDLVQQMHVESMNYVRPSIILALGKIGGREAYDALRAYKPTTSDDEHALQLALERSSDQLLAPIRIDEPIDGVLDLLCRFGTETVLSEELVESGLRYEKRGPGYVRVKWSGSLSDLFQFRCFHSISFPVTETLDYPLDRPHEVADAFARSPSLNLAVQLTERDNTAGIRYRITFELPPQTHLNRRDWIHQFLTRFEPAAQNFSNSPSRYSWEFLIQYDHKTWYLGIRPTAYEDARFTYRITDIPAALNPSVAAAMVRLVPYKDNDVILDPFCGSGTLLIERARYAPYQLLVGIDKDGKALTSAHQNAQAAGLQQFKLFKGDSRKLREVLHKNSIKHVNTIITNTPYGVRVESPEQIRQLYPTFMQQAATVLLPDGHLVMLAKEGMVALRAARQYGFMVEQELRVDTGGILVWLLVFRRA